MSLNIAWQAHAACAGHPNPEAFFPSKSGKAALVQSIEALEVCAECPVVAACNQFRIETGSVGVWGGSLTASRDARTPPAVRIRKARCGTRGGYDRHLRRNESPCQACRTANIKANTPQGSTKKRWSA